MKKRSLAVIICLMLLVAVLPVAGLTAYAASVSEKQVIDIVEISGFKTPIPGEYGVTAEALTVPENAGYRVTNCVWLDYMDSVMGDYRKFEKGDSYHAQIYINITDSEFQFADEVKIIINGSEVVFDKVSVNSYYDQVIAYSERYDTAELISHEILIDGFVAPSLGGKPISAEDLKVPENAEYYISELRWSGVDGIENAECFGAGIYNAYIRVDRISNDYLFIRDIKDNAPVVRVNGDIVEPVVCHNEHLWFNLRNFAVGSAVRVDTVEINGFVEPQPGALPADLSEISISGDERYSLSEITWWNYAESREMEPGEKFEVGKNYSVNFIFAPDDGFYFENSLPQTVTINGKPSENTATVSVSDDRQTLTVWGGAYQAYHYIEPEVNGYTSPVIGEVNNTSLTLPKDAACNVETAYWYNAATGKVMQNGERFKYGCSYMMYIMLEVDNNYKVKDDAVVTINGSETLVSEWEFIESTKEPINGVLYNNDYVLIVSKLYEFREPIDVINIRSVKVPEVGAASSAAVNIPNNSDYTITDSYWMWENDEYYGYMTDGEEFRSDRLYYHITEIEPNNNFTVDDNTIININGAEDLVDYPYCTWDGMKLVVSSVVFDFRHATGEFRINGPNRQKTAVNISSSTFFPNSTENVVIASGDNYADALAGAPLANALDASIMLVRNDSIDNDTLNEIKRLGAKNVYILGGELAVGKNTENLLKSKGYNVIRIAGANRFETAVKIAEKLQQLKGSPSEVFIAYGYNYPDALAVSSVAAIKGVPILYISNDGAVNASTAAFLEKCSELDRAYILGGYTAIAKAADSNIGKYADVERVYGSSRYDTCLEINKRFADCFTGENICVATGTNYPDALAGGVYAARNSAPMLLCGKYLTNAQREYLTQFPDAKVTILGGEIAVSNAVANMIPQYAE